MLKCIHSIIVILIQLIMVCRAVLYVALSCSYFGCRKCGSLLFGCGPWLVKCWTGGRMGSVEVMFLSAKRRPTWVFCFILGLFCPMEKSLWHSYDRRLCGQNVTAKIKFLPPAGSLASSRSFYNETYSHSQLFGILLYVVTVISYKRNRIHSKTWVRFHLLNRQEYI
jgi:hypothetical protein